MCFHAGLLENQSAQAVPRISAALKQPAQVALGPSAPQMIHPGLLNPMFPLQQHCAHPLPCQAAPPKVPITHR